MQKQIIIAALAAALVAGGAGFAGGMKYGGGRAQPQFSRGPADDGQRFAGGVQRGQQGWQGQAGMRQGGTRAGLGGAVIGEIIAKDDKSITVKLADGGSKIVFLGSETKVTNAVDATFEDLKEGERVAIMGEPNSDGSLTARSVRFGAEQFFAPTPARDVVK